MRSTLRPRLVLLAACTAVAAIACADGTAPGGVATLATRYTDGDASCTLTVSGTVSRYTGEGGAPGDTLGTLVPLPGSEVRLTRYYRYLPDTTPDDSIPTDTIPTDTIPNDTIPNDTIPNDSTPGDSLGLRLGGLRFATSPDTVGGPVTYRTVANRDGTYSIGGLCAGYYRIDVIERGNTGRSMFTHVELRTSLTDRRSVFSPLRR